MVCHSECVVRAEFFKGQNPYDVVELNPLNIRGPTKGHPGRMAVHYGSTGPPAGPRMKPRVVRAER